MLRSALRSHPIRPFPSPLASLSTPSLVALQHGLRLSSTAPFSKPTPIKSVSSKVLNSNPPSPQIPARTRTNALIYKTQEPSQPKPKPKKTMAELDAELMRKLEEMSGGGGEAGLELENGKPVAMKRGVRENMFRLI